MTQKTTPFVKWAGGKTQILDKLTQNLPKSYNTYYEPFVGAGAFVLSIQPHKAVINDINDQLINVYNQLKVNVESVINKVNELDAVPCDKEFYLLQRENFNQKIANNILNDECAALMIWINKHCFNGLYRVNSKGLFNVPYNNKISVKSIEPENLRAISEYLNNSDIQITQGDFEKVCQNAQAGDFVYFDSPYVPVSETANFTDYAKEGFSYEDHCRLASLFRELDQKGVYLMLSNHNVPLVHELYEGFSIESFNVSRRINRDATKRDGQEVLIKNF
jgi:DNA adenine methylase